MKKLITLIFLFISINLFSQEINYRTDIDYLRIYIKDNKDITNELTFEINNKVYKAKDLLLSEFKSSDIWLATYILKIKNFKTLIIKRKDKVIYFD